MTSFSSLKIALRISSATLSGLAPLAVVASVTELRIGIGLNSVEGKY